MLDGEIIIYAVGATWLAIDLQVGASKAISLGLTPFLGGDAIKMAIAALLLPGARWLAGERSSRPRSADPTSEADLDA